MGSLDNRQHGSARKSRGRWMGQKRWFEEPQDHGPGRSRGGFGSKLYSVVDGRGSPLSVTVTPAQVYDSVALEEAMQTANIPRHRRRGRRRPRRVVGDKAYSCLRIRHWCSCHNVKDVIPFRSNERPIPAHRCNRRNYRRRNIIERRIGWLKENRRLATRYEKPSVNFAVMVHITMIEIYARKVRLSDSA